MAYPKRGYVYLVDLNPTFGVEIQKIRPCVIVQNDVGNQYSPMTSVAPITSRKPIGHPTEVIVKAPEGGLKKDSVIIVQQIRAIDKRRMIKRLGNLKLETMRKVDQAIVVHYDLK